MLVLIGLYAFGNVQSQSVKDNYNGVQDIDTAKFRRRATPLPYIREADVMWSKRLWRVMDLREKVNQPFYYPTTKLLERESLFDVLKDAIAAGQLTAYDNPLFDDEFKQEMSSSTFSNLIVKWDTTNMMPDPDNPDKLVRTKTKTEITSENVKQYLIKEDWFFDKQRSVMEVRIIGICPLVEDFTESGEFRGYKRLFWIYFPDARHVLAKHYAFIRGNYSSPLTFDDLFLKRMFSSQIVKESNVFDRSISEYANGLDILLEADRIKNDINIYENDMWHY